MSSVFASLMFCVGYTFCTLLAHTSMLHHPCSAHHAFDSTHMCASPPLQRTSRVCFHISSSVRPTATHTHFIHTYSSACISPTPPASHPQLSPPPNTLYYRLYFYSIPAASRLLVATPSQIATKTRNVSKAATKEIVGVATAPALCRLRADLLGLRQSEVGSRRNTCHAPYSFLAEATWRRPGQPSWDIAPK